MVRKMKSLLATLHRRLFRLRYAVHARSWTVAEARSRPDQPHFLISGFVSEAFGIGRAARLTVDGLASLGYRVTAHDLRPSQRGLLTRPPRPLPVQPDIWLIHANPPEARMALVVHDGWQDLYRIGYWAWESDLAPCDWLEVARWFHEIWVPSRFVRDAFARAFAQGGLDHEAQKLRVVSHPVAIPNLAPRPDPSRVRVLTQFDPNSGFDRKNPEGALRAWLMAFPDASDAAELIIKSHAGASGLAAWQGLKDLAEGRSDIVFIAETLSDADHSALLESCDILLSLHRAEGFGLPLAEAMAAGKAVIATEGTGNSDFMSVDNSILIPATPVPASIMYNGPKAAWQEPDITAAAQALRQLLADSNSPHTLGQRARADMQTLWSGWRI